MVLINDALNTFIWLYGVRRMAQDHSDSERGNPLPSLHAVLYDILYAQSHKQAGTLAGTRNRLMGPPLRNDPTTHRTMRERSTTQLILFMQSVRTQELYGEVYYYYYYY